MRSPPAIGGSRSARRERSSGATRLCSTAASCCSPTPSSAATGRAAAAQIDAIERDQLFAFAVPVLRAWLAHGTGQGDPLAALPAPGGQGLGAAYAAEHRPLLLAVLGRAGGGRRAARRRPLRPARGTRACASPAPPCSPAATGPARFACSTRPAPRLRPPAARSRRAGRCPARSTAPSEALAELLVRLSLDLHRAGADPAGRELRADRDLARAGQQRGLDGRRRTARPAGAGADRRAAARQRPPPTTPSPPPRATSASACCVDGGDREAALAEALGRRRAPPRPRRAIGCGSARSMSRWTGNGEAAEAFGRALALRADGDDSQPEWLLQLMRGGALDQAGDWPEAREALQRRLSARARAAGRAQLSRLCAARSAARMSRRRCG